MTSQHEDDGPSAAAEEPRFRAAADFKAALLAGAGLALLAAAAAIVGRNVLDSGTLTPLALFLFLLAVALFLVGWVVGLRHEVWREHRRPTEAAPLPPPTAEELARFGRLGGPIIQALGALITLGLASLPLGDLLQQGFPAVPGAPRQPAGFFLAAGLAFAITFPLLVFARTAARVDAARLPEAPSLAVWLRAGQWMALLTGITLLLEGFGLPPVGLAAWVAAALLLFTALIAAEGLVRAAARLLRTRPAWHEVTAPVELASLGALFRGLSPVDGWLEAAEHRLGFTLRTAWAVRFLRRSLPPLVLAMAALLWLSTALVVVRPEEEGVRLRFGRLVSRTPVGPGLAWKLPWPFERIDRHPTRRVASLSLGQAGGRRAALLWTQSHTGVEYSMLLGDGRELVAVDAEVSYRIRDVVAYALNHQNPREALDALAYRLLMHKTVVTALDRLLSVDRDRFAAAFTADLQQAADAEALGLEILHTGFVSLHPPVRIAPEYQAVVGAQIERDTLVIRAEADGAAARPRAAAEAEAGVRAAEGAAAADVAEAEGQAARFLAACEASRAAPELFAFRRWLEALEEGLGRAAIDVYVLDHTLEEERPGAGAGEFWLDLRPGGRQP
ncbi:MAG: hypothetical protein JXQ29_01790 [Planctomycetes bacterium]|nr:hypothetical protein [Planctomycetota bacterium]